MLGSSHTHVAGQWFYLWIEAGVGYSLVSFLCAPRRGGVASHPPGWGAHDQLHFGCSGW